jgi:hypothetical protein
MAGAALVEARRLFRNATAGMWFEGVPSLMELRLHKERADKTPYHEIADYIDPEPNSVRVVSVVCKRVERLRDDATTTAMRLRVEHLKGLRDQNQAVNATPPEAEPTGDSPQASAPDGKAADRRAAADWNAIEISFLSDERVQIRNGAKTETCNYGELGFADGRTGKPNQAWLTLRALAQTRGIIRDAATTGRAWPKVEKRIQEIRKALRNHFGISTDPVPFVDGTGYQACFKIGCSPSFDT